MGRPLARAASTSGLLPPQDWPSWVLDFGHGWHEATAGERSRLFHQWRQDRAAWVEQHRPDLLSRFYGRTTLAPFLRAARAERRRRAELA